MSDNDNLPEPLKHVSAVLEKGGIVLNLMRKVESLQSQVDKLREGLGDAHKKGYARAVNDIVDFMRRFDVDADEIQSQFGGGQ